MTAAARATGQRERERGFLRGDRVDVGGGGRPRGRQPSARRAGRRHQRAVRRSSTCRHVKVDFATMVTTALPRGGLTPLMFAARQGALGAARALADAGANLNLTDPDGMSAMVIAIINGHHEVGVGAARQGRRSQRRRQLRDGRTLCRGRHAHRRSADRSAADARQRRRGRRRNRPAARWRTAPASTRGSRRRCSRGSTTAAIRISARGRRRSCGPRGAATSRSCGCCSMRTRT